MTNLQWTTNSTNCPTIYWDPPKDPNLTVQESQEYMDYYINDGDGPRNTAGYLVYRSNTRDGEYFLVSGLITQTRAFTHVGASVFNDNWYKARVVDTAGYISDFSEPLYVKKDTAQEEMIHLYEKITACNTGFDSFAGKFLTAIGSFFSRFAEFMTLDSIKGNMHPAALSIHNFRTASSLQFSTPTPTPRVQFVTATPTLRPQYATPSPGIQQNTPTPSPRLQPVTPTPTPEAQKDILTPTPKVQYVTPTPTPLPQKATPTPLEVINDPLTFPSELKLNSHP